MKNLYFSLLAKLVIGVAIFVLPMMANASHGNSPISDIDFQGNGTLSSFYTHSNIDHPWFVVNAQAGDVLKFTISTTFSGHAWFYRASPDNCAEIGDRNGAGLTLITSAGNGATFFSISYTVPTNGQYVLQLDSYIGQSGSFKVNVAGSTIPTVLCSSKTPPVAATSTKTNVSCFGGADGSISVSASAGQAPYTYSINGGATYQSGSVFQNLSAGTYTVKVKDAIGGTTANQTVTVSQPQPVMIAVTASGATSFCPGGSVILTASGADSYSWSNGATGSSITVSQTGVYSVTGTSNSCSSNTVSTAVTVFDAAQAPMIAVSRSNTTNTGTDANTIVLGYGAQNLTLTASGSGSFSWDNGSTGSSITVSPTSTTTYTATSTTENGCTASTSITITVINAVCGNKGDKVLVCHKGQMICIAPSAVAAHLAHGCSLGACSSNTKSNARIVTNFESVETVNLISYPNPAVGKTNIEFNMVNAGAYSLEIYDMKGSLVKVIAKGQAESNKLMYNELDATSYSEGVYLVKLLTDNQIFTKRIMIAK